MNRYHVPGSPDECIALLASTDDLAQTDRRTLADFSVLIRVGERLGDVAPTVNWDDPVRIPQWIGGA